MIPSITESSTLIIVSTSQRTITNRSDEFKVTVQIVGDVYFSVNVAVSEKVKFICQRSLLEM